MPFKSRLSPDKNTSTLAKLAAVLLMGILACNAPANAEVPTSGVIQNYPVSVNLAEIPAYDLSPLQIETLQNRGYPDRFLIQFYRQTQSDGQVIPIRQESWYYDLSGAEIVFRNGEIFFERAGDPIRVEGLGRTAYQPENFTAEMSLDMLLAATGEDGYYQETINNGIIENGELIVVKGLAAGFQEGRLQYVETVPLGTAGQGDAPVATFQPTATPRPTSTPTPSPAEQLVGSQCITKYYNSVLRDGETTISSTYRLETMIAALDDHNVLVEVSYRNADGIFAEALPWQYSRNLSTGAASLISEHGSKTVENEVLVASQDSGLHYSLSYSYTEEDWRYDVSGTVNRDSETYLIQSADTRQENYDPQGTYASTYTHEIQFVACSAQPVVDVNLDGSGDYASLEEALTAVPPGATLWLSPGTFEIEGQLRINKPISIFGAGRAMTSVTSRNPAESLLRFEGPGSFMVRDIGLEYWGDQPGHVLVIVDGDIDIQTSSFFGAVRSDEQKFGGIGIYLSGSTTGLLKGNQIYGNAAHGIEVDDHSQVTLDLNYIYNNGLSGIVFFDDSLGILNRNSVEQNGRHGISVNENAQAEVTKNSCLENAQAGIQTTGTASAEIFDNTLANGKYGVVLKDQSEARLENNGIFGNSQVGIYVIDNSKGVVIANEVYNNKWGLYLEKGVSFESANNVIHDNSSENIHDER